MATASVAYSAVQTIVTTALATLASDATNVLAGWQSAAIDNAAAISATGSNFATDVHVGGVLTVGATTPVANRQIEVWSYGSWDGVTYTAGLTGVEGLVTLTAVEKATLRLLGIIPTDATASHAYEIGPMSIAAAWGGAVPRKHGLWVVQNSGAALSSAALKFTAINFTSV